MCRYYKLDMNKLQYRVVWRWGNPRTFLLFAIRKTLGLPQYGPVLVPAEPQVDAIAPDALEPQLRARLDQDLTALVARGCRLLTFYTVPTLGPARSAGAALVSADASTAVYLVVSLSRTLSETALSLVSVKEPSGFLATSSAVHRLSPLPGMDSLSLPGAPPLLVLNRHMERTRHMPLRRLADTAVVPLLLDLQQRRLQHGVATGLYVPATEEEIARGAVRIGGRC